MRLFDAVAAENETIDRYNFICLSQTGQGTQNLKLNRCQICEVSKGGPFLTNSLVSKL